MVIKIAYYLEHNEERRAIAHAGWKKATHEYTSERMVEGVFQKIQNGGPDGLTYPKIEKTRLPVRVRGRMSAYYIEWAIAFIKKKDLSRVSEIMKLVISNYPFVIPVRWWASTFVRLLPDRFQRTIKNIYSQYFTSLNKGNRL
jgi:hypothetical protein